MSVGARSVLVLCLGNRDRGDDGIGPAVADRLEGHLPRGAVLSRCSGDVLAQIDDWQSYGAIVCVDAAAPMGGAGAIHRIDLGKSGLPFELASVSSHAFGLGEALALARTLGFAPPRIVIYAVEGESFAAGAPMTRQAGRAVGEVARQVAAEVAPMVEAENAAT